MSSLLLSKARTALALGVRNVGRVAAYRLRLRAGIHPVQRIPVVEPPRGPFFAPSSARSSLPAPRRWQRNGEYFGWFESQEEGLPDWHRNPFTGARASATNTAWWTLPDFDASVGDIKTIWEASRFDWVLHFAQRATVDGDDFIDRLNAWLLDWNKHNPPYRGHNWKCGQEASIRVMHLAVAALVLRQAESPEPPLVQLLEIHLERIAPTLAYAMGQDNNHGTSEAAALVIGGSWLERAGVVKGAEWHRAGRRWLADRAERLIERDGSFSQYSVTYHRVMLDTLSLVEVWRRHLVLQPFAEIVYERATAATEWLRAMTDASNGGVPNIGANDGANLLPLTDADCRDFRPSVQLAAAIFQQRVAYPEPGPWHTHQRWLDVEPPTESLPVPLSRLFDDGGYALLRRGNATVILRYPRFRFRPSHADALHLDLWVSGDNLLRDGGTFSYNADPEVQAYFAGAPGHNSVQFDDHEQMLRLGRFLWGGWLKTQQLEPVREVDGVVTVAAAYEDRYGATHTRRVALRDSSLVVEDIVAGFASRAVLRWRLRPGHWCVTGNELRDGDHRLTISASVPITRCELVEGWESRYYMQRTAIPVVEIEIAAPGMIVTEYRWRQ